MGLVIARHAHKPTHGRGLALNQRANVIEGFAKPFGRLCLIIGLDIGGHGQREIVVREKRHNRLVA